MIIHGECLEEMKKMADNSISAIVTDPPYGLSFMGKGWDHEVPQMSYWKEALRIAKPGSFLLSMGGSRTFHRLACEIEDAGWEIRDCISWLYGSGFPKSHNHFGIDGYGTALKPAWEPIIMAMKPCDGTFAQNVAKWGQAGINIDRCRISGEKPQTIRGKAGNGWGMAAQGVIQDDGKGRWPANIIFDEEAARMLDEQSGVLKSGSIEPHHKFKKEANCYGNYSARTGLKMEGDKGGASRFFYCAKASSAERNAGLANLPEKSLRYDDRRASSHDIFNTEGCNRNTDNRPVKNHHPTVKPLKLMEYLIKLVMPPKDGILLDPFAGSGTTILAAQNLGVKAIGIEKSEEYCEIARARIKNND